MNNEEIIAVAPAKGAAVPVEVVEAGPVVVPPVDKDEAEPVPKVGFKRKAAPKQTVRRARAAEVDEEEDTAEIK